MPAVVRGDGRHAGRSTSYIAEALGGGATRDRPALSGCYED